MSSERPMPVITPENKPYWDAVKRGELRLQRCCGCDHIRPVPADLCPRCLSEDSEWVPMNGRGSISSWCIYHRAFHPAFEDAVPYTIIQADLEEGVRFIAPLSEKPGQALEIGQPVRIAFERIEGLALPVLRLEAREA